MKPVELLIENFLGIGSGRLKFDRPGLTLVEGINHDSKASKSNGAGKSSIWEALLETVYGVTKREGKGDDIVNKYTKGGKLTALEIEVGGMTYVILRTRRRKPWATGLYLFAGCSLADFDFSKRVVPEGAEELTGGTMKDTQIRIDELVGMSAQTFIRTCFFGQGDVKPFAGLTDGELKQVFTQALGITFFDEAASRLRGYINGIDLADRGHKTAIDFATSEAAMLKDKYEALANIVKEISESKAARIKTLKAEIDQKEKNAYDWQQSHENNLGTIEANNLKVAELTVKCNEVKGQQTKLTAAISQHNRQKGAVEAEDKQVKRELDALNKLVDEVSMMIGKTCVTCGREYTEMDVKELHATTCYNLSDKRDEAKKVDSKWAWIAKVEKQINEVLNPVTEYIEKVVLEITTLNTGSNRLKLINDQLSRDLAGVTIFIERAKADIESLNNDRDFKKHMDELESTKKAIHEKVAEVKTVTAQRVMSVEKLKLANELMEILGNGGIKSYIFDAITPELNKYANDYLSVIDELISVEITTVSKTKAGDLREKFEVKVDNRIGGGSFKLNSGGEKQKVNLAIALAFNRVMRSMSADVPLLVLDEPFEALDADSSERVTELLGSLDAKNIYLVTHNQEVKDLVSQRLVVEKRDKVAHIREAA
jgi:DNA repair exonuclease SbcCD ATPase subunit